MLQQMTAVAKPEAGMTSMQALVRVGVAVNVGGKSVGRRRAERINRAVAGDGTHCTSCSPAQATSRSPLNRGHRHVTRHSVNHHRHEQRDVCGRPSVALRSADDIT
jgi:hypothetical protein